jgi:hypothetical protein
MSSATMVPALTFLALLPSPTKNLSFVFVLTITSDILGMVPLPKADWSF